MKLLHVKWIVDLYHHLKADNEMIANGLKAAGISEAIKNAHDIMKKVVKSLQVTLVFLGFLTLVFLRLKQKKVFL